MPAVLETNVQKFQRCIDACNRCMQVCEATNLKTVSVALTF